MNGTTSAELQAEKLFHDASDHVTRTRLLGASCTRSRNWPDTLPLSCVGLKLDNATVRTAAGLRLSVHQSYDEMFALVAPLAPYTTGITAYLVASAMAGTPAITRLVIFICHANTYIQGYWRRTSSVSVAADGQTVYNSSTTEAWSMSFLGCNVPRHVRPFGSNAAVAEANKTQKYSDIIAGADFVPFAIETSGVWSERAMKLVKEIGRRDSSDRRVDSLYHIPQVTCFGCCSTW